MKNNSPSILFISIMNGAAWGGSEIQWLQVALYGKSIGYDVNCMLYHWPGKEQYLAKLIQAGIPVFYIPNKGKEKKNIGQRLYHEWIVRLQQKKFISSFNFFCYDYVYINQGGFSEVTGSPWKNLYKKLTNYSLGFHNYDDSFVFAPKRKISLQQWINNAHHLFFASQKIKESLNKKIGESDFSHSSIIKNPITIERSNNYTPFPPLLNGQYKIVMLSYLDVRRKAQDNLIKAFDKFCQNKSCILEFYGSGNDANMLQKLVDKLELNNKVFLKGHTDDVANVLQQAHIITQLTHIDAMPISVVEAMSLSRALLYTPVGDMSNWLQDGVSGFMAKNSSIEEMITTLEKAWSKKEQWEQMGKNAFDAFNQHYPKNVNEHFYSTFIGN